MKIRKNSKDITHEVLERIDIEGHYQLRPSDSAKYIETVLNDGAEYQLDSRVILVYKHEGIYVQLINGLCDSLKGYTNTCDEEGPFTFIWVNCYEGVEFKDIFKGKHQKYIKINSTVSPEWILSLSEGTFKRIDKRYFNRNIIAKYAPIPTPSTIIPNIESFIGVHFRAYEAPGANYRKDLKSLNVMIEAFKKIYDKNENYLILSDSLYVKGILTDTFENCLSIDLPVNYESTKDDPDNLILKRDYKSLHLAFSEIWHAARCRELYYTHGRFASYLISSYRDDLGKNRVKKLV